MRLLSITKSLFKTIFSRKRMEDEMDDELRFHLEARAEDLMSHHGLSYKEALRQARLEFGSLDKCREQIRESRGLHFPDTLWRNTRYALRQYIRNPGFTITAVLTLALGIGANTAIYTCYHTVLMKPLPVEEPERLVNLASTGPKFGRAMSSVSGSMDEVFSYPMFQDLAKEQTVFTGIAAQRSLFVNLSVQGETWSEMGFLVSGDFFQVLGVKAAMGRLFTPEDDAFIGEPHVVVLSHSFWKTRFGGDADILNRTMTINGQPMTIIGITERGFEGNVVPLKTDIFIPITMGKLMHPGLSGFENRQNYWVYLSARLKPGVSQEQAQASLNHPYHSIINEVEAPLLTGISEQSEKRFRAKTITLQEGLHGRILPIGDMKGPLNLLMGLTIFFWIIVCTNVSGLLLAKGAARRGEIAVRQSIGASRAHVVTQLLTEFCILALLAGIISTIVLHWTLKLLTSIMMDEAPVMMQSPSVTPMLLFAVALTLGTGLLFGLFPALQSTKTDLSNSLKVLSAGRTGAQSSARFRKLLCTVQIALALALLVTAGLFTRSLFNVNRINLGFKTDNIVTFGVHPERNGYSREQSLQLFERLEDNLAALPGIIKVTSSLLALLGYDNFGGDISVEGFDASPDTDVNARYSSIGHDFFYTLGIPVISGREFNRSDALSSPKVAIVNEAFVEKFNLGRDAVGKFIGYPGGPLDTRIVGLVRNSKFKSIKEQPQPFYFRPYRQSFPEYGLYFYIKTTVNPELLLPEIRSLMAQLDPNLPVDELRTMTKQVHNRTVLERTASMLTTASACLAILLTALGLYGVLAYTVTERTRDIGLCIALGASRTRVRATVFRQIGFITFIGCIAGLILAVGLGYLIQSIDVLYQIDGLDPAVFFISTVTVVLIALAAGLIPAYRASRIDPMQALRSE